ncbi:MAG: oligoendopeptidase F [Spirochaetales bacterium]|jgi:oligoendopeptidase F|nr:oligoendopeptidase F [Spirochaetales bacterium]
MAEEKNFTVPERKDIPAEHKWDLGKLFADDSAWDKGLEELTEGLPKIEAFKGTLGDSAVKLREVLDFMNDIEKLEERLGYYAMLRFSEDAGANENQERYSRYMAVATKAQAQASYQTPEIQAISDEVMNTFLEAPELQEFLIPLKKILRFKPHVLSENEERLLAMQSETNQTAQKAFGALTDVDMEFGEVETDEGVRPLTQSTWGAFMINPDRELRKTVYTQFYKNFEGHKNTLATLYSGSVQLDKYRSQIRNYPSSRGAALFPDDVPADVYDNLLATIRANLPSLHEYYEIKRKALGLDKLMHYDVYVPFITDIQVKHTYEDAVDVIGEGLKPLGEEYNSILRAGLLGSWVDRYENKGKRSGAFSAGSYIGDPHILINFKEDVLRDVFTLAHEGGHSMHSWYSSKSNPFQYYNYTIFEAEVASTFNEQLLAKYMMAKAEDDNMVAYLIGKQLDDVVATIFRQTMFAQFEHDTHAMLEAGTPLTVDSLRGAYRKLLEEFFGDKVGLLEESDLEGLRIPHFYRAFYVYKYSTGLAASIALARGVLNGGKTETDAYLNFLKSGGSRFPLESLKLAGVDMSKPEPVQSAMDNFKDLLEKLKGLLGQ